MTTSICLGRVDTERLGARILRIHLTRIVLALVFFMVPFLLIQAGATDFFEVKLFSRLGQLVGALVGCLSYAFYVTRMEKRAESELGLKGALGAGVFLAAAFLLTGRLGLCAALHAAWNFFQDGIFSLAVSGHQVKDGLLVTELSGPDWLTGGAFGIEGAAVDLAFLVVACSAMLLLAWRRGRFVQPV